MTSYVASSYYNPLLELLVVSGISTCETELAG